MTLRVPTDPTASALPAWARKAATAINQLISSHETLSSTAVIEDGNDTYTAPTISNPPTQAEVQAIADALEAVSIRLKG